MRLEYFQLIDRIVDIDLAGRKIQVEATVPAENTIFEGHFPGYPLMPGVLLCEAMAQTSGWLIMGLTKFAYMPFLAAFKEAKLRTFVTPGAVLSVSAEVQHEGSGYTITMAKIMIKDRLVCNAVITFRLLPFPSPEVRMNMEKFAASIDFPMKALTDG